MWASCGARPGFPSERRVIQSIALRSGVRLRRLRWRRLRRSRSILNPRRLLSRLHRLSKRARCRARLARSRCILDARLRLLLLLDLHTPLHVAVQLLLLPLRSRLLPLRQPRVLPPLLRGLGRPLAPLDRGRSRLDNRSPRAKLASRVPGRRRLVDRQRLIQRRSRSARNRRLHRPMCLWRRGRPLASLLQHRRQTNHRRQKSPYPDTARPVSSHPDHLRPSAAISSTILDARPNPDAPELDRCPWGTSESFPPLNISKIKFKIVAQF